MIEQNITVRGLRLDDFPVDLDKSYWTYALNQVYGDEYPKLSSEPGNELCVELPYSNWYGTLLLERGQEIVFIGNGTTSEIGLIEDCTYTTLIRSTGLNFQDKIINPIFRIVNGCERIIYFNDFINPDRAINLDKLDQYTDEDSVDLANQNDTWNVDEFSLSNSNILIPEVTNLTVQNTGGSLQLGQYRFAIEILDESLNSIYVGPVSGAVAIYDESTSDQYDQIDGGSNIQYDPDGVPPTNKSIVLSIDNLDTRYPFYRIYVLKRVQGFDELIRINQEILTTRTSFTYRGDTDNDIREDISKLTISYINYDRCRHMQQVDRKLVRANLKEKQRDYAAYQQKANLINTSWVTKEVEPFSTKAIGNSKNPNTYFFNSSFQGDEVYALGIVYYHSDGTVSPAFHIPGKSGSGYDRDTLTVVSTPTSNLNINVAEVRHLGYEVGDTLERWELYNTAQLGGRMAFYEADTDYPDTLDCNGNRIFPTGKIRHHKLPSRSLVPVYEMNGDNPVLNLLGLEFNNVEYPNDDIVGHQFVMVERNDFNSTVLDYGFFAGWFNSASNDIDPDEEYYFSQIKTTSSFTQTDNVVGYFSPDTLLGNLNTGSHFTIVGTLSETSNRFEQDTTNFNISGNNGDIEIATYFDQYLSNITTTYLNRSYDTAILAAPRTRETSQFDKDVTNGSHSNNISVYNLLDPQEEVSDLVIAVNKQFIKPYENILNLEYKAISGILTGENDHQIYSGDVFLCDFKFLNIFYYQPEFDNDYEVLSEYIDSLWVECKFNYDLIHGDRYVPHPNDATVADTFVRDYIINKVADVNPDDDEYIPKTSIIPEEYLYNTDYDILYTPKSNFSLPVTYNYCSDCPNYYPNRIAWSLNSLADEDLDAFRVFLNENYTVVGEGTGMITGIHYDKNRMLVRTMQSMFQLAPNPQVISTDVDTAYLGTGDFLSIPPNELVKTNYGYAGGQGKWDMLSTEYGLLTIDQKSRQVFLFTNNLKELSSKQYGAQTWFRENLNSECEVSYDPRYKRVIISNDDWTISYSPEYDTFVSFHSYIKNMYHTYDRLHWVVGGSVYKQADRNFCNFFGQNVESKIEFVVSNRVTSDLECIEYYAQTQEYVDSVWIDRDYPTFSKFLVYTQQQSTGEQELQEKQLYAQPWSNTIKTVVHAEQNYRICQIRDLADTTPVSRKAGIEIVPNNDNLDFDRDQRFLIPIKDKWFKVKFTFEPEGQYKLIFDVVQTQLRNSQL